MLDSLILGAGSLFRDPLDMPGIFASVLFLAVAAGVYWLVGVRKEKKVLGIVLGVVAALLAIGTFIGTQMDFSGGGDDAKQPAATSDTTLP